MTSIIFSAIVIGAFASSAIPQIDRSSVLEFSGGIESRTTTHEPNAHRLDEPRLVNYSPPRDAAEGLVLWSAEDENAISDRIALSTDGDWMVVGYTLNDQRFEFRSARSGELIHRFDVPAAAGWVDIDAGGDVAAFAGADSVWMFGRSGAVARRVFAFGESGFGMGPLALSDDGNTLIATGTDRAANISRVWCFRGLAESPSWTFEVSADIIYGWFGAAVSGEGGKVVVNGKYWIYALNLNTGELLWEAPAHNTESPVAMSKDGSVLVTSSLLGRLRAFEFDEEAGGYVELWFYNFHAPVSSWVTACRVSADGATIAAGTLDFYDDHYDGRLAVFDAYGSGEPLWMTEPLGDEVAEIAISADGGVIAAALWGDYYDRTPDLAIFERHSAEPFFTLSTPGSFGAARVSEDGSIVVAGGKGTHYREFGRGGRIYAIAAGLIGGYVSGAVTDLDGNPLEDVDIAAVGNPYLRRTNGSGFYTLPVETRGEAELTILARRHGFKFGASEPVLVRPRQTSQGVDFVLQESGAPPEGLRAASLDANSIRLQWDAYNPSASMDNVLHRLPLRTAIHGTSHALSVIPDDTRVMSHQDDTDEARQIKIHRSPTSGGPYTLVDSVDGGASYYTDHGRLFPRYRYYYVITAEFEDGESDYSNEAAGRLRDDYLLRDADLTDMTVPPAIDGSISEAEWAGSVFRDISDVFGYDERDTAGSVDVRIGFSDATDLLYLGFRYHQIAELQDLMGVGVYVDDNGDGEWNYDPPGHEGNYWGYWRDGQPDLRYRSLSGAPYNVDPYFQLASPLLAFGDADGKVEVELALPLGFHSTEEIALQADDFTIGLGLFAMHRDDGENPVFDGWWPQDMLSIVSQPDQFARVRIPATLAVPPQAPDDVALLQVDEGLKLNWRDPELAIDGGALNDFAGIRIYRNGARLTDIPPGVESVIDTTVAKGGWYEYALAGFILEDGEPFEGSISEAVGAYAVEEPRIRELSYDDGGADAFYVVSFTGADNRFASRFTFTTNLEAAAVYWVEFFAAASSPIRLFVAEDEDGEVGAASGDAFVAKPVRANEFHRFHFPALSQPLVAANGEADVHCWAVLQYLPESPSTPAIGVDDSRADDTQNKFYTDSLGWNGFRSGQLMIRLGVGKPAVESPPSDPTHPPDAFSVEPNYPNPFNSLSLFGVDLPDASDLRIVIYDAAGRIVQNYINGYWPAGRHRFPLNAAHLGGGSYFVRVEGGGNRAVFRIVALK